MTRKTIISNLAVAFGYFIGGQIGLFLAIPPSNAAAVWPASGIALASVLVCGNRVLPGILLGGILVQTTSFLDASSTEKILSSLIIGAVISTGGMVQAWLGARLVRRIVRIDPGLLKERSILLSFFLAGPVACITSASIGMSTLWYTGVILPGDIPLGWSTWWIGDSIGVLVFAPVVLCLVGVPHKFWRQRAKTVAIPLCVLAIIAFLAFEFSNRQEMQHVTSIFNRNTLRFADELQKSINAHIDATNELKEFFNSSTEVTKGMFMRYAQPKLSRHPEIQALEWIPRVTRAQRAGFEQRIGSPIRIPDNTGEMAISPDREFYYPVQYVVPLEGNEKALGYDIRNTEAAHMASATACSTGNVSVTDPVRLVQSTGDKFGVVFYAPVYRKNIPSSFRVNCENLAGFTASVFRLENEIENIQNRLPDLKISVSLEENGRLFYSDTPEKSARHNIPSLFHFKYVHPITIANQQWDLVFTPASGFISTYSSWTIWLIIVGGLMIAGFSGMGLLMLTGRALRTEDLVAQRTSELNREIRERKHIASLLVLEKKALEMIAHDHPLQEILDVITTDIEEILEHITFCIFLLDESGSRLRLSSAPSLPRSYRQLLEQLEIKLNDGISGKAAYLNKQVFIPCIDDDPSWHDYREIARRYDLKACWSTPIAVAGGKVLGTFDCYFNTQTEDNAQTAEICSRMANIVSIAILRKQSEEQLTWQASHDTLTGLVNRREFERRLERLLDTIQRDKDEHALCFLDLDQFKVVNDTCGHSAGDELLRQLSTLIQELVRKRDTLARLGGDEFAVLMEHCDIEHALRVANSLQQAIQDYQFVWEGRTFRLGVSIGLVSVTEVVPNRSELLKMADAACYMAKDMGRNRIHIYHGEDENLLRRHGEMQWVNRIQKALEEDRFCLYAQYILPLRSNGHGHYELLIRMIDEEGKLVPPGAFLPAAERYNIITALDRWVVENTFRLLQENPGLMYQIGMLSINLSGQSLVNETFLTFVNTQLYISGIPANKICFEITETAAISNLNVANKFISTLKESGCHFALDDFGSGLSSFGYLKNLNVDYLKIDGMFVKDIVTDPIDRAMVKSINEIGQVLGMQTIAEFVENDAIKELLSEIGVDFAQGYGIRQPSPLLDLIETELNTKAVKN